MDGSSAAATSSEVTGLKNTLLAGFGLLAGCYSGFSGTNEEPASGGMQDGESESGESDPGEGETGTDGDDDSPPTACEGDGLPSVALRFLTRHEYENTVRDLFGRPMDAAADFVPDESVDGFFANSARAPSQTQLERFFDAAQRLAADAVTTDRARFADCDPELRSCAEIFVSEFGRRAFRRPLRDVELDELLSDYDALADEQGGPTALEAVATSMLASPHFLYIGARTEEDDPSLQAYDLASRLSYFLWSTMPDDALFDAAADGELGSTQDVERHVRRMLDDPRAAQTLHAFARQWLEVEDLWITAPKNADIFVNWTSELADAAERDVARLMEDAVLEDDGRLATVLLSRRAWANEALADLYGVSAPEGGEGWVELPEGERAGLLTRAAFLAGHAHTDEVSWVHRGKLVRERLLCETIPPPPPVADDSPLNDDSRLEDAACAPCHTLMDPIGVGLNSYDAIGAFTADGSKGSVVGFEAPDFDGGVELSEALAASEQVVDCFADQMFVFAHRRTADDTDSCEVDAIREAFASSDGDIRELMVELATSEAFRGMGDEA